MHTEQAAEAVTVAVVFGLSYVFFKALDSIMGLRVSRDVEIAGLYIPEMGTPAYPENVEVVDDAAELPATARGGLPSSATA